MSIHIVLFLFTKIIPMSCHQHFAHSAWKLLPKKLFRKIIPRCNLHIGIISDGGGHENDYRLVLKFCWKSTLGTLRTQSHYKLFFQFSGNPAPSPRQSPQFGCNFPGQNWIGTFQKPSRYRLVYIFFGSTKWQRPTPSKKLKKISFWFRFWGLTPAIS